MKKLFATIFTILSIFSVFSLNSCDFENPIDGLEVRLNNIVRNTYLSVEVIDAQSGQLITAPVKITFTGDNAGNVISTSNLPITSITTDEGVALFSLSDDLTPSDNNPVTLNAVIKQPGYIATSKPLVLHETGLSNFQILLTNPNNTPTGVISKTEDTGTTSSSGATTGEIVVNSGTETNSNASATVSIPTGTILKGSDGTVLTGNIETRVTYFNPTDESSINAFPGGLNNVTVVNENGVKENVSFITGGFVAIDVSVGGVEVENFGENNAEVSIELPQNLVNPETGTTVKPGDVIPLWSYDEDEGTWKFEKNLTVPSSTKPNGNYELSFKEMSHLSYWNVDWFYSDYCSVGATLQFNSTTGCFSKVRAEIYDQNGQRLTWWAQKVIYSNDATKTMRYIPRNTAVTVKVFEYVDYYTNGAELGSVSIPDLCANQTYTINFTPEGENNIHVDVVAKCTEEANNNLSNDVVVNIDGYPIYMQKVGTSGWQYIGTLEDGKMDVCLEYGAQYYFKTLYDGEWYYSKDYNDNLPYTIDQTDVEFTILDNPDICDDL